MAWRIAESLKTLRTQINAAYPNRDKASDGGIGNAEHASRNSDHNPWVKDSHGMGVVTAIDIDEDLASNIHSIEAIVSAIRASRDKRVKYIIYERRITVAGSDLQRWKAYHGANAHEHHAHISVNSDPKLYDSTKAWDIGITKNSAAMQPSDSPSTIENDQTNVSKPVDSPTETPPTTASKKNEQDVNKPITQEGPKPYNEIGLKDTLKNDAKSVLPANGGLQMVSEYAQQATGWPPWVIGLIGKAALIVLVATIVWLLYRIISYLVHTWRENERVKLMALINTDVTRKNIEFVPPPTVEPPVVIPPPAVESA